MGLPILNDDLRECYENAISIRTILEKELRQVDGNKSHLEKLVPDYLKEKYAKTMKTALQLKQRILRDAYKSGVILLTATFERVAFAKYKTATGDLISFIDKTKGLSIEYDLVKDKLVKNSLSKLKELIDLLEGRIELVLYERLNEIREQRNSYAHGNADGVTIVYEYTFDEIVSTFDTVLIEIEKRPSI